MEYFKGLGSLSTVDFGGAFGLEPEKPIQAERPSSPGLMSDVRRASGQFVSGVGSTLRDLGAEDVGGAVEQYGAGVVQRNPSEIRSFDDVLSRPFTTAREAVGEVVPQVGLALGSRALGALGGGLIAGPPGALVGGFLGGLLPTAAQTYGGIRTEQRAEGIDERGRALAVTIPAALLERFGGAERVALRVAGEGTEFLRRAAGTGLTRNAAQQFARGGVEELITEIPQTALERYGVTGETADLTSPEALSEYGVAGAKGFLGGGTVRAGLSSLAGTRPTVTVQPDGTITSDQPVTGAEGETDLTGGSNVLMTPEQATQRLQQIQARRPAALGDEAFTPASEIDLAQSAGRPVTGELTDMQRLALAGPDAPRPVTGELTDMQRLTLAGPNAPRPVTGGAAGLTPMQREALLGPQIPGMTPMRQAALEGPTGIPQPITGGAAALTPLQQQALRGPQTSPRPVSGELTPAQQAALAGPDLPRPVTGELSPAQQAALAGPNVPRPVTGELTPAQQAALAGPNVPRPVTGELTPAQQAAIAGPDISQSALPTVPAGVTLTADENRIVKQASAIFSIAETDAERASVVAMVQRTIDRAVQRSPAPVTPVGAPTAVAAALPAAQPAAGVSSTATTGAPSGTQAPQAVKAKTQRTKAPAAPAAAAVTEEAAKPLANVSEAIKEDNEIDRVLKAIEAEDDAAGDKLFAGVTGQAKKAPGRPSMPTQVYAAIRNAILNPKGAVMVRKAKSVEKDAALTEKYKDKIKRIAAAAKAFADAYETYSSQNLVRSGETIKRDTTADAVMANRAEVLQANARAVQSTLAKLGEAVEGNAKDVEAIVRFVKDRAQKEKRSDQKVVQNDILLSRAWAAAKRETFIGEPDLLDVSPAEVRQSRESEAKGATPQLVEAATEGYQIMGKGEAQTGLNGILNYIRTVGTPFEKTLAQAIKLAVKGKAPIKIKFVKEGTSQYDPKTNTITINETSSKEVALHEALHGALQWFVYTNPNAAQVVALKAALQRVVNFDTAKLTPKAAEVQAVLKKTLAGKSKTAELDAVLELVSYGNTLNDFRRALQGMESNAPRTFVKFANDVMEAINALVRRMLGVKQSVASDVIENTIQLLESARQATQETAPKKGNVLQASVQSGTSLPADNAALVAGPSNAMPTPEQLARYTKTILPRFIYTEMLFNKLGWAGFTKNIDKSVVTPVSNWVQENMPALARGIAWVNSTYGLPVNSKEAVVKELLSLKDNRRGGTATIERAKNYIASLPVEQSKAYLQYMNERLDFRRGLRAEPKFKGDDTMSKVIADVVIDNAWKYMTEGAMDQRSRDLFLGKEVNGKWVGGIKFTEAFVFPDSIKQLASNTFGARNLRALKSSRVKDEVTDDAITFRTDADGSAILNDSFIGLYKPTPELDARLAAGETWANIQPDEFISAQLFAEKTPTDKAGQPMKHDAAVTWNLDVRKKGGYRFTALMDAKEALGAKSAVDVANAFQNTMTLLANAYSTYQFANGLNQIGAVSVDDKGKVTARDGSSVVFDTLAQLNEALNSEGIGKDFKPNKNRDTWTRKITQESLINVSSNEARADAVQSMFRNRAQWVRVPANEQVYGELAGKIVNGSVWAAIQDASDRRPVVKVPYAEGIMRFFKGANTVWNPATWGNNVGTNFVMAMADDIPMQTIAHASRLYAAATLPADVRRKMGLTLTPQEEQLMAQIINSNALQGTFSSSEIKAGIYEAMRSNLEGSEKNIGSRLMQFAGMEKSRVEQVSKLAGEGADKATRLNELMQEWYSAQDNVFRVASVLNYMGKAVQQGRKVDSDLIQDAGRHAREAFLDYDIDAKAVRIARQTALPFVSWPYAATKLVAKLAIHSPWKLVNLYVGLAILDGMMSAMTGDDDEDEIRKAMPEYMRERLLFGFGPNAYIRLPFGDDENPTFYGIGKYMFPSSLADSSPQGFAGVDWWPSALTPTGPFISSVLMLVAGIDPFTGEKLSAESASNFEAVGDRLKSVQSMFAPNLPFIDAKETEKFLEAVAGRTDKTPNHASLMMARYLGLRVYDMNIDAAMEQQDRAVAAITKDYKMEVSKLRRQQERMESPDWDTFYEREEEILKRLEKRLAKLRGEEPPEE